MRHWKYLRHLLDVCHFGSILILPCMIHLTGCSLFRKHAEPGYETIASSPGHDSETALKEHEKAVKLIQKSNSKPSESALMKAEKHLQKALTADVNFGPAHNTLGMVYFLDNKLYLAAWEYQYAAKLMPDKSEPLYNLGLVYESASNLNQAIVYYELGYQMDSQNPYISGNLARALIRNGEPIERTRVLLEELLMYDQRGDWLAWAKEILAMNPVVAISNNMPKDQPGGDASDANIHSKEGSRDEQSSPEVLPQPPIQELPSPIPNVLALPDTAETFVDAPLLLAPSFAPVLTPN